MAQNVANEAYRRLNPDSDEYLDLFHDLVPVLKEHFGFETTRQAADSAHTFLAEYDSIRQDMWTREAAATALDNLRRALVDLNAAYQATPHIVLDDIHMNEEEVVASAKQKFMKETKLNMFVWSNVTLPKVTIPADALKTLCNEREGLLASIEITRKTLPQGFKTRNRPVKDWALIGAAVSLVRWHNTINIPDGMDRAGDMCRLLRDVFLVFGIKKNSFKGVYDGWKKHMDSKYENADLLGI